MLGYLIIVIFAVASRSLGKFNCSNDFFDAKEAILNNLLHGVLENISSAFFPTNENEVEYLVIHYFYKLNCINSESNHSNLVMDYIWTSSSVYLVVEPNAFEDLTGGIVDVTQGNVSVDLQCFCSYPNDVTAIFRRLTAYVSQKNIGNLPNSFALPTGSLKKSSI